MDAAATICSAQTSRRQSLLLRGRKLTTDSNDLLLKVLSARPFSKAKGRTFMAQDLLTTDGHGH